MKRSLDQIDKQGNVIQPCCQLVPQLLLYLNHGYKDIPLSWYLGRQCITILPGIPIPLTPIWPNVILFPSVGSVMEQVQMMNHLDESLKSLALLMSPPLYPVVLRTSAPVNWQLKTAEAYVSYLLQEVNWISTRIGPGYCASTGMLRIPVKLSMHQPQINCGVTTPLVWNTKPNLTTMEQEKKIKEAIEGLKEGKFSSLRKASKVWIPKGSYLLSQY